jgi:hypothetical protein
MSFKEKKLGRRKRGKRKRLFIKRKKGCFLCCDKYVNSFCKQNDQEKGLTRP